MKVIKRDGELVFFDSKKIELAITKAALETGEMLYKDIFAVATKVALKIHKEDRDWGVEEIQDLVEAELMINGYVKTARAYVLYREGRNKTRK